MSTEPSRNIKGIEESEDCDCQRGAGPLKPASVKIYERPHGERSLVEHERGAVAILNVGGMNHNAQQEADGCEMGCELLVVQLSPRALVLP